MKIDIEKYRSKGLKLTPQRIAIIEYLDGNLAHPTAEDIFKAIKKRYPTISFATVYNTIEALKERGILKEVKIESWRRHFENNVSPHSHIICSGCGKIRDVSTEFSCAERLGDEVKREFEVAFEEVSFFGVCRDCSSKKASN